MKSEVNAEWTNLAVATLAINVRISGLSPYQVASGVLAVLGELSHTCRQLRIAGNLLISLNQYRAGMFPMQPAGRPQLPKLARAVSEHIFVDGWANKWGWGAWEFSTPIYQWI